MSGKGLRNSTIGNPASPPFTNGPYEMDQILVLNKPAVDSYERYVLVENFERLPQANASIDAVYTTEAARNCNTSFELLGTNAADNLVTFGTTVGGLLLTTATATNDSLIVLPHLDSSYTAWSNILWGTENQVIWEAVIRTGASITDVTIWAGLKLTNTPVVATDANQVFFRYDGVVANWECTYSIAGTDSEVDSGVAVAVNTNYYFRIEIDSSRKAHFFINNKEVHITTALTNDIDLIPYLGVMTTATSGAKTMYIVKEKISRIIYE
jgi:hypothetical protein